MKDKERKFPVTFYVSAQHSPKCFHYYSSLDVSDECNWILNKLPANSGILSAFQNKEQTLEKCIIKSNQKYQLILRVPVANQLIIDFCGW